MRRHKQLFPQIITFPNLLLAAQRARRRKRQKPAPARFHFLLEHELWQLQDELRTKRYRPGGYRCFMITDPKRRVISAAPYRDRVVHHALHNVLEPIFEPTFIHDSYATRQGKGTYAAIARFQQFARRYPYVLKCDVRQYFPSVRHDVLMELIGRKVACRDTKWLITTILNAPSGEGLAPTNQPTDWPPYRQSDLPVLRERLFEWAGPLYPGTTAL